MWKSMLYKEWLKIRWFVMGSAVMGLLAVAYIFLNTQRSVTFSGANSVWYGYLFQNINNFGILKYIPLLIGVGVGVAQYFPETVNKRIKLTFHLPIDENKALIMMLASGLASLLFCYALHFLSYIALSNLYFGTVMTTAAIHSLTPWFLAGFASYFLVALIVLEPIWKYRIFYALITVAFIPLYLKPSVAGAYAPVNLQLALVTILISGSLLFSAYRFRKGEM